MFKNRIEELFVTTNHKIMIIIGDINIDLLNSNNHKKTEECINTLFSISRYPKITRLSRITTHTTSLIENIFTNELFPGVTGPLGGGGASGTGARAEFWSWPWFWYSLTLGFCCLSALGAVPPSWGVCLAAVLPWLFVGRVSSGRGAHCSGPLPNLLFWGCTVHSHT